MNQTLKRIVEKNGSKCHLCNRDTVPYANDYTASYLIKQTLLCVYCRSAVRFENIPSAPPRIADEKLVVDIYNSIKAACEKVGASLPSVSIWPKYVSAPRDKIQTITNAVVNNQIVKDSALTKQQRKQPPNRRVEDKMKFGRLQQNKCIYCDIEMHYKSNIDMNKMDPDKRLTLATWEHIIDLNHGGDWTEENMVIACHFCNLLRNTMKMTHDAFAKWVTDNRNIYDQLREKHRKRIIELSNNKKNRPQ